jgi:hypothetical protein
MACETRDPFAMRTPEEIEEDKREAAEREAQEKQFREDCKALFEKYNKGIVIAPDDLPAWTDRLVNYARHIQPRRFLQYDIWGDCEETISVREKYELIEGAPVRVLVRPGITLGQATGALKAIIKEMEGMAILKVQTEPLLAQSKSEKERDENEPPF